MGKWVDVYAEGEWVEFMSVLEGGGAEGPSNGNGSKGGWVGGHLAL